MNIFSNFFGNKTKTENQTTFIAEPQIAAEVNQIEHLPLAELFIDNEIPQPEQHVAMETHNKITVFLNRNYLSIGANDGYEYHTQETLDVGKKKIRSEFQLIIDQSIQEKIGIRLQTKNMIAHIGQISDATIQTLQNTIEELNSSLLLLQNQKELSAENEGWVMNAIYSYHQGFIHGLNDYISGEKLLNSIKNI